MSIVVLTIFRVDILDLMVRFYSPGAVHVHDVEAIVYR